MFIFYLISLAVVCTAIIWLVLTLVKSFKDQKYKICMGLSLVLAINITSFIYYTVRLVMIILGLN